MRMELETISPTRAKELLSNHNTGNRNVRDEHVIRLADDMRKNRFKINAECIKIGLDGTVLDGQHRLYACIKSKSSFRTWVAYDVPADVHPTIDTGVVRTLGDELRYMGEQNTASLAALIASIWRDENDIHTGMTRYPSRQEGLRILKDYPYARDVIRPGANVAKSVGLLASASIATAFLLHRAYDSEVVERWRSYFADGIGYETSEEPGIALRNYAANVKGNKNLRPNQNEWLAICLKATNAWLLGRPVKYLRWRSSGPQSEDFPSLVTGLDLSDWFPDAG